MLVPHSFLPTQPLRLVFVGDYEELGLVSREQSAPVHGLPNPPALEDRIPTPYLPENQHLVKIASLLHLVAEDVGVYDR